VLRTSTYSVEVSVVGTRADGSDAGDLEASSVRVWDNGVPQAITAFEKIPSAAGARATAPPPTFFSNRREPQQHNQVLTIVLFDAVNTDWVDQMRARRAVMEVVAQRPPEEHVAVLVLGNTLRVLHDFSSDRDSLLRKLKSFWGDLPYGQDFDPSEDAAGLNSAGLPPRLAALAASNKILNSLYALEAVANYVKDAPGRKNLIWVTGGFPLSIGLPRGGGPSQSPEQRAADPQNFGQEFAHAVQALNSADVSVYPIDARGLTPSPNAFVNIATMREFASRTGGVAYYNRNDLDRGVRKVLDETREVYFLSYTPRPFTENGSFHQIRVETSQRGVQLRYRRGYYAPGLRSAEKVKPADRLREAVSSPVSVSEIGLDARLEPDAGVSADLKLVLRVDGADLDLLSENGSWSGGVSLVFLQTNLAGEALGGFGQTVRLNLSQDSMQRMLGGGLVQRINVPRQPNAAWLRIGLLDERSGRVGSIRIPLSR
jgi:VWFA-related protein